MKAYRKAKKLLRPNEFYTPSYIIEAARACMGGIDLDPASCTIANETVCATRFYSHKDDGLKQPWFGRVWLNPPFGKFGPLFVRRISEEIEAGNVSQAVLLLKVTHLGTGWFTDAMTLRHLLCFPRRRINFYSSIIKVSSATFPSVLIGLGIEHARFAACAKIGATVAKKKIEVEAPRTLGRLINIAHRQHSKISPRERGPIINPTSITCIQLQARR